MKLLSHSLVGEYFFYSALSIVKVSDDSTYRNVAALLSLHLKLLNPAYSVRWVEDLDLSSVYIAVAFKSRLARVARGCNEYKGALVLSALSECAGEESWHYLKRHILEGTGGTVPKLEHIVVLVKLSYGGRGCTELFFGISSLCILKKLVEGIIGEEL